MTLTIDAGAGSATANSFCTEATAIDYMAARLNASAWTTVSGSSCTESEKAALIEATRELTVLGWVGARATATQALAWPRTYAINPDAPSFAQQWFASDVVPQRIQLATAELAFQFLKAGSTDVAASDPNQGVIKKQIDVIVTEWMPFQRPTGLALFPRVQALVQPLLASSGSSLDLVRG